MTRYVLQAIVALAVMGLTANYLAYGGQGYGVPIHPYVTYGVIGAALAVPVFWFISHFAMAIVMGVSGGGLAEGIRLGFILGLGMALGRCWLNVAAISAGIWIAQGPLLWVVGAALLATALFALDWVMHYFWRSSNPNHDS
jgi:hypothetical protein